MIQNTLALLLAIGLLQPAIAQDSYVPKVSLEFWNQGGVVTKNNCYNYATNRRTDKFAQPGETQGIELIEMSCDELRRAVMADVGVIPTEFFPFSGKRDEMLIALAVSPNLDYHWYRRGDDNLWTHKPGYTEATNLDVNQQPILSPETANRGLYTEFCGYFRVKNFITSDHEQNGGYVRIGNMHSLPTPSHVREPSTVRILQFSGRRDKEVALSKILPQLNSSILAETAQKYSSQREFGRGMWKKPFQLSNLGYRGILIVDTEGLLFPPNTTAQLFDGTVYIESLDSDSRGELRAVSAPELKKLEDRLRKSISNYH